MSWTDIERMVRAEQVQQSDVALSIASLDLANGSMELSLPDPYSDGVESLDEADSSDEDDADEGAPMSDVQRLIAARGLFRSTGELPLASAAELRRRAATLMDSSSHAIMIKLEGAGTP